MNRDPIFKMRPKTSGGSSAAPDYLVEAPNTPAAVFSDAEGRFAEIYGSSMVQSARWFLVAVVSLMVTGIAVLAAAMVFPLKEVRPFVVEVNPSTGIVNRPVEVVRIDPSLAVVKAELARWAEAVYGIDPLRTSEALRWANARTADKAIAQFAEFRVRERIFDRIRSEPEMVREVKVTAVDAAQRGTAFIFLTTTERVGSSAPAPEKTKKFRVTINYRLMPATQESDLLANPLGLYVTFFADTEERAL